MGSVVESNGRGTAAPSVGSLWTAVSGTGVSDALLLWPPDVFALTDTLLERSQAYRFAVSPPPGRRWPPADRQAWAESVSAVAAAWVAWAEEPGGEPPALVAEHWAVVRGATETMEDLGSGEAWELCESLLTLHAASDEACAVAGVALSHPHAAGYRWRGRARELLARTGSMSRIPPTRLRVLPKATTAAGGISFRSLARYACVCGSSVDVSWSAVPDRTAASVHTSASVLLLPWPLRIRSRDFKPVRDSVRRVETEPFGFFEFTPDEPFDDELLDRVLASACDEGGAVDVVVLPESAVRSSELERIEAVLGGHGVAVLIAGVRDEAGEPGALTSNWVHLGVRVAGGWRHYRQDKHHRWFLDEGQIDQYHLASALHPSVRWWEAMAVPKRRVQFLELSSGVTLVAVVCEDLARLDEVADLLRVVGPTIVLTLLLDGPQLASRWTARYASVLADDPGSSVLTLSAYGMVQRSRPPGRTPSSVVALWKDGSHGLREISLEPGAHGVLLSVVVEPGRRRSADGRTPIDDSARMSIAGVHQVRAADTVTDRSGSGTRGPDPAASLDGTDLSVLTSWAQAAAAAILDAADDVDAVTADALADLPWREALGLAEPSRALSTALAALHSTARAAAGTAADAGPNPRHDGAGDEASARLVRAILRAALDTPARRAAAPAGPPPQS